MRWIILLVVTLLFIGGFQLYQMSIGKAVYSTTMSFMNQLADHDQLNIVNQMNNKWEYLSAVLERIRSTRDTNMNVLFMTLVLIPKQHLLKKFI